MNESNCTDFNDYQQKALRTLNSKTHVENMTHAIMGMVGEAGEFTELKESEKERRISEIGDCLWYAAVLANELKLKLGDVIGRAGDLRADSKRWMGRLPEVWAMMSACRLTDDIKKTVFYGKPLRYDALEKELILYVSCLIEMSARMPGSLFEVAKINIKKLEARYPDLKFDADRAINRDYVKESAAAGVQVS